LAIERAKVSSCDVFFFPKAICLEFGGYHMVFLVISEIYIRNGGGEVFWRVQTGIIQITKKINELCGAKAFTTPRSVYLFFTKRKVK
jgi:hypothetical protein